MNETMNTSTQERVYEINGQIVSEYQYKAILAERRGESGF